MNLISVCPFLTPQGGMEDNIAAFAGVALEQGHRVTILSPYQVQGDATIWQDLAGRVTFLSAQEAWRRTLVGGLLHRAAAARYAVRTGRAPTRVEAPWLARSYADAYVESFWTTRGRRMLSAHDIILLFGHPRKFVSGAARCAHMLGKQTVYVEVSQVTEEYATRPTHRSFAAVSNLINRLIVYDEQQAADFRAHFGYRGQASVVEQWAYQDEDRLLQIDRTARSATSGEIVFGSLSRLSHEKGLPELLRAFAAASKRAPHIRLKIAGQGQMEAELRQLSDDLSPGTSVEFLGYVPDKVAFYDAVDVFVVNSEAEGGPITGVEAMAAGLPIITTPVGAMPDRLGGGPDALFVDVGAVGDLSAAIVRLAGDASLREKLGQAARRRYLRRNHSSVCIPALVDAWRSAGLAQ